MIDGSVTMGYNSTFFFNDLGNSVHSAGNQTVEGLVVEAYRNGAFRLGANELGLFYLRVGGMGFYGCRVSTVKMDSKGYPLAEVKF